MENGAMRSVAELAAAYVQAAGVRQVFTYPGESIIEFMDVLHARGVAVVSAAREGTAAFMAEGAAMATGLPGVCLSTLGPGSTAVLNGVASATLDRVPMLAISGQIESNREQFFTHQVVDHARLFGPVTKAVLRLDPAAARPANSSRSGPSSVGPGPAGTVIRKALRTATAERPGAVHLTVTADTWSVPAGDDSAGGLPTVRSAVGSVDVYGDGDPLAALLAARRPVLLAGIGALRCAAGPALVSLAERAGLPVVISPMAKGTFPEDHAYFAGVLDMTGQRVVWQFLDDADLILTAGFDPVELISPWSVSTPVLHLDTTPNADQIYASEHELVGNVAALLDWVSTQWKGEPRWTAAEVAAHRNRLREAWLAGHVEGALNPSDVVTAAREAAPSDAILVTDVGSHKIMAGQVWRASEPRSVLMTNGLSAMGFGVPAAIGAKLARPERPVIALVGDGGFAMTATEMRIAADLGAPITVVVFADRSLNRIELRQQLLGLRATATRVGETDIPSLAASLGCDGARAETPAALEKALAGFETRTRPLVIEARINTSEYEAQF
jgi:acetolactate synthase-1/2/3 large subunit